MYVAYIQADIRVNPYLLEEFLNEKEGGNLVIGYTLDKVFSIQNFDMVILNVYDCKENRIMVDRIIHMFPQLIVRYSEIADVNERFLMFAEELENEDFIIRILGEAVLLDVNHIKMIMKQISSGNYEAFFCSENDGSLVDLIKVALIKKERNVFLKHSRYFHALNEVCVKRLEVKIDSLLPFRLIVVDSFTKELAESIIEDGVELFSKKISEVISCFLGPTSYFYKEGYIRSLLYHEIKDNSGNPIPWYTYSAIDYLIKGELLKKDMQVFEFGCGSSTKFYSEKVQKVIAVEHDYDWYKKLMAEKTDNIELHYIKLEYGGEYCKKILQYHSCFDIVVIDGRDRVNCAIHALGALKENGIIIFDNTERNFYISAYEYLAIHGFKRLDFWGYVAGLYSTGCTSIFYRNENVFNI